MKFRGLALSFVLVFLMSYGGASSANDGKGLQFAPEGDIRFYQLAVSEFDSYLTNPSDEWRSFMQNNYARMQVFDPFFDDSLWWYDGGWAYKNVYAIKPSEPEFSEHPEWILRDAKGNMLYIDWGCSGGTCPQFAADFGNPEWRAHWIQEATSLVSRGYRGFWMDDVNMDWRIGDGNGSFVQPIDPRTGQLMRLEDWRRYMAEFCEEVRAALPSAELAHNLVWYAAPRGNQYLERQIAASDYVNLERGFNDAGLTGGWGQWSLFNFMSFVDYVHEDQNRPIVMMDYTPNSSQRLYGLAGYLLMNTGRDMFSTNHPEWTAPDNWWPALDVDLGKAYGKRYWTGKIWRRDFEKGIVLVAPPGMPGESYPLNDTLRTLDNQQVTSVFLEGSKGTILYWD